MLISLNYNDSESIYIHKWRSPLSSYDLIVSFYLVRGILKHSLIQKLGTKKDAI